MMRLSDYAKDVERHLSALFPERADDQLTVGGIPPVLYDAMRYSLMAGGKRLRGSMLLALADMLIVDREEIWALSSAVEMIHASSLIHDDLPAMDDDDMRRGKPTNHIVFGEGQAVLAGDGLLNYAFEIVSEAALQYPENALRHMRAIAEIAKGSGVTGMMGGQSVDLDCEKKGLSGDPSATLDFIHAGKTAAMFVYPMRAVARVAGADEETIAAISAYAAAFGRLFQVVDDILDETGNAATLGKSTGKDKASGKMTAVSVYGLSGARQIAADLCAQAQEALSPFGDSAEFFRTLICEMQTRTT